MCVYVVCGIGVSVCVYVCGVGMQARNKAAIAPQGLSILVCEI